MDKKLIFLIFCIFLTGWLSNTVFSQINFSSEQPFSFASSERSSPSDRVPEDNIFVYKDKVVINLANATWATFTDTNSMDPFLDYGSNSIEVKPQSETDLAVGDIISYESSYGLIVHRITEIKNDSIGWYCRTKGDNNQFTDPGKIRFEQIHGVLVAIIY